MYVRSCDGLGRVSLYYYNYFKYMTKNVVMINWLIINLLYFEKPLKFSNFKEKFPFFV